MYKKNQKTFNYIPSFNQIPTKKSFLTQINSQTQQGNIEVHNWPCLICMKVSTILPFASCRHILVCVNCAQQCMIQNLKQKKLSKCLIENCNAQMLTGQGSSFSHFSEKTKKRYNQVLKILSYQNKLQENSNNIVRNCRAVNCNGYINLKNGRCILCEAEHCLDCLKIHSRSILCDDIRVSFFANDFNFKRCKVCKNGIQKIEGCAKIRCNNCNHLFCYQCQEPWTAYHHLCQGGSILKLPYYYFAQACLRTPQPQIKESFRK